MAKFGLGKEVVISEKAKEIMKEVGDWVPEMEQFIGQKGTIVGVLVDAGSYTGTDVEFDDENQWCFTTDCFEEVK